jgi:hypothetical protein
VLLLVAYRVDSGLLCVVLLLMLRLTTGISLSLHFSRLLQLVDCDNTPCKVNQCEMKESE